MFQRTTDNESLTNIKTNMLIHLFIATDQRITFRANNFHLLHHPIRLDKKTANVSETRRSGGLKSSGKSAQEPLKLSAGQCFAKLQLLLPTHVASIVPKNEFPT